jgi:hypothetical protein
MRALQTGLGRLHPFLPSALVALSRRMHNPDAPLPEMVNLRVSFLVEMPQVVI